jgi:CxxC-x17-CxxC domain-containing protein
MPTNEVNFFALTTFRNEKKKFGIKTDDRRRHFYCIGKTGMGKSNLMENMAIQDIQAGRGVAYVDPHGEGAEKLLDFIPQERINDVIFFNPADLDYPIAFNVMEKVDFRYRHLIAGGLMGVFKKVWPDVWSARMEYILSNTILALLEYPDSTLLGVNRMLADVEYREKVVAKVTDPMVRSFWVTEYARYTQRYEVEATAAIQNKVGQFISNPLIRNLIGQIKSTIDMREIMDKGKIFIMDLSKGRIGEDNSHLLGALLITRLQLAAMSRVDIPEEDRKDFYLYVDEFQNFVTESFANILSEARKYRLNLTIGHQYIAQLGTGADAKVRDAVFGNVGTLVVFRIGAEDAEFLEREFTPQFTAEDLVNLPKYNVYLKLMIDGVAGHPFSAQTLPPPQPLEQSNREKIIRASRERYGVKREIVEEKISRWSGFGSEEDVAGAPMAPSRAPSQPQARPMQQKPIGHLQPDGQTTLYDAICSICGKPTKVIFPPEEGRPVYCKSCMKKIKAGTIIIGKDGKAITRPVQSSMPAVADQNLPVVAEPTKIQDVSFHNPKNKPSEQKPQLPRQDKALPAGRQAKRKEVDLSELRKALQESLANKDESEETVDESAEAPAEEIPQENIDKKSPEEQLNSRIEEEKEKDEEDAEESPVKPETNKKPIKPGETVRL